MSALHHFITLSWEKCPSSSAMLSSQFWFIFAFLSESHGRKQNTAQWMQFIISHWCSCWFSQTQLLFVLGFFWMFILYLNRIPNLSAMCLQVSCRFKSLCYFVSWSPFCALDCVPFINSSLVALPTGLLISSFISANNGHNLRLSSHILSVWPLFLKGPLCFLFFSFFCVVFIVLVI